MAQVTFYAKPGCPAAARQTQQLQEAGHELTVKDLMAEPFTADTLKPFFGDMPVETWLNRLHPKVKKGEIDLEALDEATALGLMLADRELIRRPLMQVGDERQAGFNPNRVHGWIGLLPKGDGLSCDDKHKQGRCDHGHQHFPK